MTTTAIVPIVGGGPAGMSCALWLKNYGLHPVLIERKSQLGGMQRQSPYPDFSQLGRRGATGRKNAEAFTQHIEAEKIEIVRGATPRQARRRPDGTFALDIAVAGEAPRTIHAFALVIATGTDFRSADWLDAVANARALVEAGRILIGPGAAGEPDADLGARVLVVGGGDNAFDVTHHLVGTGRHVTIASRAATHAQPVLAERVRADIAQGRAAIRSGVSVKAVAEGPAGIAVRFDDGSALDVDRIVLCLGYVPNTGAPWIDALGLVRDPHGYLPVDRNMETSCAGVFAVGDVSNPHHPCVATALGAGTMAAREILKRHAGLPD